MNDTNFDAARDRFIAAVQALVNQHYVTMHYTKFTPPVIEVDPGGRKYIRIVRRDSSGVGCSVWCFIEKATGNILKADGWKRPAAGVRGNIYVGNPTAGCTAYGPISW